MIVGLNSVSNSFHSLEVSPIYYLMLMNQIYLLSQNATIYKLELLNDTLLNLL